MLQLGHQRVPQAGRQVNRSASVYAIAGALESAIGWKRGKQKCQCIYYSWGIRQCHKPEDRQIEVLVYMLQLGHQRMPQAGREANRNASVYAIAGALESAIGWKRANRSASVYAIAGALESAISWKRGKQKCQCICYSWGIRESHRLEERQIEVLVYMLQLRHQREPQAGREANRSASVYAIAEALESAIGWKRGKQKYQCICYSWGIRECHKLEERQIEVLVYMLQLRHYREP